MDPTSSFKRISSSPNNLIYTSSKDTQINTTCAYSQIESPVPRLRHPPKDSYETELSFRSYATNSKSQKTPNISNMSYRENSPDYLNITEDVRNNYEAIELILKDQNENLKKQNEMLIAEIYKLKSANKKYKDACLNQKIELQAVREECEAQKHRADEMKEIIMNRLVSLQAKVIEKGENDNNFSGDSILDMLNTSQCEQH